MTIPAGAIRDEVRLLIEAQVQTFGQPTPLTASQLSEFHQRSEKIGMLYLELDRIGTKSVIERQVQRVS